MESPQITKGFSFIAAHRGYYQYAFLLVGILVTRAHREAIYWGLGYAPDHWLSCAGLTSCLLGAKGSSLSVWPIILKESGFQLSGFYLYNQAELYTNQFPMESDKKSFALGSLLPYWIWRVWRNIFKIKKNLDRDGKQWMKGRRKEMIRAKKSMIGWKII